MRRKWSNAHLVVGRRPPLSREPERGGRRYWFLDGGLARGAPGPSLLGAEPFLCMRSRGSVHRSNGRLNRALPGRLIVQPPRQSVMMATVYWRSEFKASYLLACSVDLLKQTKTSVRANDGSTSHWMRGLWLPRAHVIRPHWVALIFLHRNFEFFPPLGVVGGMVRRNSL